MYCWLPCRRHAGCSDLISMCNLMLIYKLIRDRWATYSSRNIFLPARRSILTTCEPERGRTSARIGSQRQAEGKWGKGSDFGKWRGKQSFILMRKLTMIYAWMDMMFVLSNGECMRIVRLLLENTSSILVPAGCGQTIILYYCWFWFRLSAMHRDWELIFMTNDISEKIPLASSVTLHSLLYTFKRTSSTECHQTAVQLFVVVVCLMMFHRLLFAFAPGQFRLFFSFILIPR